MHWIEPIVLLQRPYNIFPNIRLLVPPFFPADLVGNHIGKEREERSDDEKEDTSYKAREIPREHKNNRSEHIVDTIPWLEHLAWFVSESALEKTLHHVTGERSESEPSSKKYRV